MNKKIPFSEIGKIENKAETVAKTLQEESKKRLDEKDMNIHDEDDCSKNNTVKEYVQNDTGQRVTYAQMEDKIKLASLQAENNKLKEQLKTQENENKTSYMLGMKEAYEDVIKILIREGEDY